MKKIILSFALSTFALAGNAAAQEQQVQMFPLSDVRLLDSPFKHAQEKNLAYIMAMEPDRLLAPFLREAGLEPRTESYGNWESSGLDGHIGGHYLSALSLAYAATGDNQAHERLQYMLDELKRAQDKNGNGYLGGIPGGAAIWQQIAEGEIEADLFTLNGKWVPLYNIHKIFSGLRDAYLYTDNRQALDMLVKLSDWGVQLVSKLSDSQVQQILKSEHGGLNEVYADVAAITGKSKYLDVARRLSHREILQPLEQRRDALTGLHANTQIPKVIGYKRVGDLADDSDWQDAAEYFWREVVEHRTVAIGGNSVREHFHDRGDFSSMVSDVEGPETCNTYNMLKLTRLLYQTDPDTRYIRYYERALYNHILSSQNPDTGGLVYFTSMRPQHYRVYSQPDQAMWCCVGSGIENHSKYGEMIYAHRGDELFVNLFIPSTLNWKEKDLSLSQTNHFPDEDTTIITLDSDASFTLQVRQPAWVSGARLSININGKPFAYSAKPGGYIPISREWKAGDRVDIKLPMHPQLEQMPDGSDYYALLYGPVVLAAKTQPFADEKLDFFADDSRMGHIASGPMCSLEAAPLFVSDSHDFLDKLRRLPGSRLRFAAPKELQSESDENLELIPFFRLHESRYMLYWPFSTPQQLAERQRKNAEADKARLTLEKMTIDKVAPGEQQPESDHFFAGEGTEAGVHKGRHWRHASGWFSYQLKDPKGEASTLRITYYGLDKDRNFDISLNGVKLADVVLDGSEGDKFFHVDYPVPEEVLAKTDKGNLELRFEARNGSVAGGIYGVRLLRQ
ncbi:MULTISPECIES: glycoside hydrolase family 127 protein [unclassified Microbulbifer]|uniref:glycoside hydrolase family 127 protein n=1 Tax=unclassified Microbulbifer TaxID=2619833 RepID=UPI0027E3B83A|nr:MULTISPECIES: glycoside hydrolase family 127 protein [unclassified Microbulbifer]